MALDTGARDGSFCVSVHEVAWSSRRDGGAEDEAGGAATAWAHVAVEDGAGQPIDGCWFGDDDENVMTQCFQLSGEQGSDQLGYSQSSRSIALSSEALVTLVNANLKVTIFTGGERSRATDQLWGDVKVPFLSAIVSDKLHDRAIVRKAGGEEELSVEVVIQCDAHLVEYALGLRVISLHSAAICDLPKEWTLAAESDEEALRLCAAPDRNTASYEIELSIPEFGTDRDRVPIKWTGGKLAYDAPAAESPAGELQGVWSIQFPKSAVNKLYERATVSRLVDYLQVEKMVPLVVRRSSVEAAGRVTATVTLNLSGLASPGQLKIVAEAPLRKISPFPKESLEQELGTATSNDEKKRLQALINDYDNAIARPVAALATAVRAAHTRVSVTVEVLGSHPLVLVPPPTPPPPKSVQELVTPRDLSDERDQRRDVVQDLRTEIRRVVLTVLGEYEATDATLSREEKRQRIVFKLNSQGAYHQFKEKLKKRIVPLIRDRFADDDGDNNADANASKKRYFAQLFALLMDDVQRVLHEAFLTASPSQLEATHRDLQPRDDAKITQRLMTLALQALEHEVAGDGDKSEAVHLDRIAFADERALADPGVPTTPSLARVWLDYARFSLRQGKLDKGGGALRQSLALEPQDVDALVAYGALLCDRHDWTVAEVVVKNLVAIDRSATAHALLAFFYSQSGHDATGNLVLCELLQAQRLLPSQTQSLSGAWIYLAGVFHELSLWLCAETALQLADSFLRPRDVLSIDQRVAKRTILAEILSLRGEGDAATVLLQQALDLDASSAAAWLVLGRTYLQVESQSVAAVECLQRALEHQHQLREDQRLSLSVNLGLVQLQSSQFAAAKGTFLAACDAFPAASVWLGAGIALLRLDDRDAAAIALAEANRLDPTNPEVWGYLALLALTATTPQVARSQQCVAQALRHQLANPSLLRELSSSFVAIDRLEDAERLLRRALVLQDSSLTRKTLADVLAAQHCAEAALSEYQRALDESQSIGQRSELLDKCAMLLGTLGRPEEAATCRQLAQQLQAPELQELEPKRQ